MRGSFMRRVLAPVVELRESETRTALLMFAYSFLAMAGYNVIKPATRSKFIADLGADNLPYMMLLAGIGMGFVMQGYARVLRILPRRAVIPSTQGLLVACLLAFWFLFGLQQDWVSAVFYFWGLIVGVLLISQFWTLANAIYDPRQAKRLFGFIGGGAALGGAAGAGATDLLAKPIGTNNLLLVSAALLALCGLVVWIIVSSEAVAGRDPGDTTGLEEEKGSGLEVIQFLRESKHLRLIALVISFAAIGGAVIEQQLNMAAEDLVREQDAITQFLARVTVYVSLIGFVIQIGVTTRIHRTLGIAVALLILPVSLAGTALLMLLLPSLWVPALARVLDSSLRYTVDKTTREILFLPLPLDLKYRAKPFVDVAVDRFAKGVGAALALLIAIKIFHLTWWQLSYLSLGVAVLWVVMALRARRQYLVSFRHVLDVPQHLPPLQRDPADQPAPAAELAAAVADASAVARKYHSVRRLLAGASERQSPVLLALTAALRRSRDDIYRLLSRVQAPEDIEAARQALESGDARARATAAEYLDNALPRAIRRHAVPVLELSVDEPDEGATDAGEKQPGRDEIARVLEELSRDHDPAVASAAREMLSAAPATRGGLAAGTDP